MIQRHVEYDFNGKIAFNVTKPFVPHVLDAELAQQHGWDKCAISTYGNPALASEENPVVVWVTEDINPKFFKNVLSNHEVLDGHTDTDTSS